MAAPSDLRAAFNDTSSRTCSCMACSSLPTTASCCSHCYPLHPAVVATAAGARKDLKPWQQYMLLQRAAAAAYLVSNICPGSVTQSEGNLVMPTSMPQCQKGKHVYAKINLTDWPAAQAFLQVTGNLLGGGGQIEPNSKADWQPCCSGQSHHMHEDLTTRP